MLTYEGLTLYVCRRHQEEKPRGTSANVPAWPTTVPGSLHTELAVKGGQVHRSDGSCDEGKFN